MEITGDQLLNVFDKHRAQTRPTQILVYLLMISGILISVWLIQGHKAKQSSPPVPNPVWKLSDPGWSLDLTDKEL